MTTPAEPGRADLHLSGDSLADEAAEGSTIRQRCALLGIDWIAEAPPVDDDAVALISADAAVRLRVVPLRTEEGRLVVAMVDPMDILAVDEVSTLSDLPITRVGLEPNVFADLLRAHYGTTAARMAESLAGEASDTDETGLEHNLDAIEADDIHRMAEQPTLINLVNLLLLASQKNSA